MLEMFDVTCIFWPFVYAHHLRVLSNWFTSDYICSLLP